MLPAPASPPAPLMLRLLPPALGTPAGGFDAYIAPLAQELETERASGRDGLDQPHLYRVAKLEGCAGILADQGLALFVMIEIFMPDG
jgi:hypothetical protein